MRNFLCNINGTWRSLPAWARYFFEVGVAAASVEGTRLRLCFAVPTRSYAATLSACGIITTRAGHCSQEFSTTEHFKRICNLPVNTPVSLVHGNRKLKGVFVGCAERYGMKCAEIMVEQKNAGGATHLIWETKAHQVEITSTGSIALPKRQSGRLVSEPSKFASDMLGGHPASTFVGQSRVECVITGRINILRREILETEFATSPDYKSFHKGCLQDILRIKKFLNPNEPYKTDICRVNGQFLSLDAEDSAPPYVIFDGATGFIRWREFFRNSNWIVILDRTDARFHEAAEVLNQAYLNRAGENSLPGLSLPIAGVEVMSFYDPC